MKITKPFTWLITGGAGFIGSAIATELVKQKQSVVVLDNLETSDGSNLKPIQNKIKFIQADITDYKALLKAFDGVDYVLHHAALVSVPQSVADPIKTHRVNVDGTFNVLLAAKETGVKKVVVASSSAVYGAGKEMPYKETAAVNPLSPYGASKLMNEQQCQLFYTCYGLETVALRYFNVYGPKQNANSAYAAVMAKFIAAATTGKPFTIYGDGNQTRDFIYVGDIVSANLLGALKGKGGQVYNVATGKTSTLLILAKCIEKGLNKKIPIVFEAARAGDILHSSANASKIKRLGYKPSTALQKGIALMLNK